MKSPEDFQSVRVVRLFYGFQFFFSMLLWLPVFYEYQKRVGLSDSQIFGIQSLYYLAFCLLEIPTGLIADFWGHRKCMQAGAIICAFSNLLPILFPSAAGFTAHFLTIALARSLISGASSAYLYQYLRSRNSVHLYKSAEGNARAYGLVGKLFGYAAIAPLMAWHLGSPYVATVIFTSLAIPFAYAMPKPIAPASGISSTDKITDVSASPPEIQKNSLPKKSRLQFKDFASVFVILKSSPLLLGVMVQGISIFVLTRICQVNLFQPILDMKAVPLSSHGLILSGMTLFEAVGSTLPAMKIRHPLRNIYKWINNDLNAVTALTVGLAVSMGAMAFTGVLGTIVALCVFSGITGIAFPVQRQLVNDVIKKDEFRATFLSVESILDRAVCALAAACLGAYVARGEIPLFLEISAGLSLTIVILLALTFKFKRLAQAV